MLEGFVRQARERLHPDDGGYRRDHLYALAQRVEVADDEVGIVDRSRNRYERWSPLRAYNRRRSAFAVLY